MTLPPPPPSLVGFAGTSFPLKSLSETWRAQPLFRSSTHRSHILVFLVMLAYFFFEGVCIKKHCLFFPQSLC